MESPLPPFLLNGEKNLSSCQILLLQRVCQHEKGQWPLAPATCQASGSAHLKTTSASHEYDLVSTSQACCSNPRFCPTTSPAHSKFSLRIAHNEPCSLCLAQQLLLIFLKVIQHLLVCAIQLCVGLLITPGFSNNLRPIGGSSSEGNVEPPVNTTIIISVKSNRVLINRTCGRLAINMPEKYRRHYSKSSLSCDYFQTARSLRGNVPGNSPKRRAGFGRLVPSAEHRRMR